MRNKQASQAIAKDPARMREAEREGIAPKVKNFVHQAERERGREKGRGGQKGRRAGAITPCVRNCALPLMALNAIMLHAACHP